MLDRASIRKYFEIRLPGQRLGMKAEVQVKCPFHRDRTPSLSINLDRGLWKCHAGCGDGGLVAFEMKLSNCDDATAKGNISVLLDGMKLSAGQKPEAVYPYHDAHGRLLFEKVRMPGKRFLQRKPDGKGGYDYKLGDIPKPLYHLPEILVANEIFICEGEKDADNVRNLAFGNREKGIFVAATTNFDGAGKWREEYAPYFAGKRVVILPDNDEIGLKHAHQVAQSVHPYATGIRIVRLPGLAHKGDVSDFLKDHTATDLLAEIQKTPQWKPSEVDPKLLVTAPEFVADSPAEIEWIVDGVIERGANGFFVAAPKGGKSWAAVDLVISLALGCPWLDFRVPQPVRCALISREDNPRMTAYRLQSLYMGKGAAKPGLLETNLYINSRAQSPELMLDNPEQVAELVNALKTKRIEFAVFDVFNVLHAADENDNTEMRTILRQLSSIQAQVGCSIGVVHHFNKAETGGLTQRMRGASAIAGWAEWLIGITMANAEAKVRRMEFELKAAEPPDAVYYRIESKPESGACRLVRTVHEPQTQKRGNAVALELIG